MLAITIKIGPVSHSVAQKSIAVFFGDTVTILFFFVLKKRLCFFSPLLFAPP